MKRTPENFIVALLGVNPDNAPLPTGTRVGIFTFKQRSPRVTVRMETLRGTFPTCVDRKPAWRV